MKQADKVDDATEIGEKALKHLDDFTDATKGVVKNSDEVVDATSTAVKKVSKASSRKLAKNLEKAGISKPKDYKAAAHHIVAGGEPEAARSKEILESFHIDINDASNGVFLPYEKGAPTKATYHPSLNTKVYNQNVYKMLKNAKSREEVIEILGKIRDMLLNGTFKY